MSVRTRVISLLLAVFVVLGCLLLVIQRLVVYPRFLELEQAQAVRNLERAMEALQRDLDLLVPSVNDWAVWDDTYQFLQDRNQGYVSANLGLQTLRGLAIDVLAFYDRGGECVWLAAYDMRTEERLTLPRLLPERLGAEHFLSRVDPVEAALAGLVRTHRGPFLVVARRVLSTEGKGPSMGTVLMARPLDAAAIARLGEQARVALTITDPGPLDRRSVVTPEPGKLSRTEVGLLETSRSTETTTTLMDLDARPALTLRVVTPRTISTRGADALWFASVSLGITGGLVLLTLMVALRRIVLDPLSRLTAHATALGATDDLDARLGLQRRDEIGALARAFDLMTERLAHARQRLLDQSYRSGLAEMASGVLHNIGNAITPIGVKLTALRDTLSQTPVEEIALVSGELADPTTDPPRRADLIQFLQLAGDELKRLTRHLADELEGIQAQLRYVQRILTEQQRFSHAKPVLEHLALSELIEESLSVLSETMRHRVEIALDPSLARMPRIRAARLVVQQIIGNLVINAAEAIQDGGEGATAGRILLSAREELSEGRAMVHLCVRDNGDGILAEHLPHIFELGFSTKSRGSGMGLHWSANSAQGMGGRLYAESVGAGQGACLHLLLPVAGASALENVA